MLRAAQPNSKTSSTLLNSSDLIVVRAFRLTVIDSNLTPKTQKHGYPDNKVNITKHLALNDHSQSNPPHPLSPPTHTHQQNP